MNNLLDYDYDTLVDALEHDKFRTNLAEAMKRDFLLFYRVMFFLMNMQHLSTPPVIKKLATELQNSYYNIVDTAIFAPPGIGKTLTKEFFFAWTFCREKQTKWIYSNSVSEQVKRRSQEVRDIVFNKFSYKLFNNKIDPRLKSAVNFSISGASKRSGFTAKSFRANIVGDDGGNPNIPVTLASYDGGKTIFKTTDNCSCYPVVKIKSKEGYQNVSLIDNGEEWGGNEEVKYVCSGGVSIDDANNIADIRSETNRTREKESFKALRSRVRKPGGIMLLDQQRLHIEDVPSVVIEEKENGIGNWKIITIPALDENDISVWEEKIPAKDMISLRESPNPFDNERYWAQFQQSPRPSEGMIIKREYFKSYSSWNLPNISFSRCFITSDTAMSENRSADFSVISVWLYSSNPAGLYLLDMVRGRWEFPELKHNAIEMWNKWAAVKFIGNNWTRLSEFYVENKMSGTSMIQELRRAAIPIMPVEREPQIEGGRQKSKLMRLQDVMSYICSGMVYLPDDKPDITNPFIKECEAFSRDDSHTNDDMLDTMLDALTITFINGSDILPSNHWLFQGTNEY